MYLFIYGAGNGTQGLCVPGKHSTWATLPALLFPFTGNKTEAQTGGLSYSAADQVTTFWPSSYSGRTQEPKITPIWPSTVFCSHTVALGELQSQTPAPETRLVLQERDPSSRVGQVTVYYEK